ncbi:DUF2125 domain-containing protein [Rubellimicrobium arenae]|uniref:DUF2125 domain-containing protein n=1 Tax=Rubellimicrobium arenae TaxID=2817372 RepID=UPI001B316BB5|nr:DUF2125 domain-containing protein [Rubellimicrobium arenae]
MRVLFFVVAVLAALYGGYWFVGSSQVESRARAALAQLEERGWDVAYSDLSTEGFPSRFDTTVTDLHLATPGDRVTWDAPFVQLLALSYRPNQVIAIWPPEQRLSVLGQPLDVTSDGLRASATVGWSTDLPLDHAVVESGPLNVTSGPGWNLSLDRVLAAIRTAGPAANSYDIYLEGQGLRSAAMAGGLEQIRLDTQAEFAAPLDRRLEGPPQLRRLTIRDIRLAQGGIALSGSGGLAPDDQGFAAGEVTLAVENWRGLLDVLDQAGLLPLAQRAFLLALFEQLAQGRTDVSVPLTFADGRVEVLGVALLEAPRLR